LNQVEIYFTAVQRKGPHARRLFCDLDEVAGRLLAFQKCYNATAHPFDWTFTRLTFTNFSTASAPRSLCAMVVRRVTPDWLTGAHTLERFGSKRSDEVRQIYDNEDANGGGHYVSGALRSNFGSNVQLASITRFQRGTYLIGHFQANRREELDIELTCNRHVPDHIKKHSHHVIEHGDHSSPMRDARSTSMPTIEHMLRHDAVAATSRQ
jgi:hypothetical protein